MMQKYRSRLYQRRWTTSAIECWERGCVCSGCQYENFFSGNHKCKMKLAVLDCVHYLGIPEGMKEKTIIEDL